MKYKVVYVSHKLPKGYIGMNAEAAKAHGIDFPYSKNTIVVDDDVSEEIKRHTRNHETIEHYLMSEKHMGYKKAHGLALKFEHHEVSDSNDVENLVGDKTGEFKKFMALQKQEVLPGTTIGEHSTYDRSGEFSADPKKKGKQKEGVIPMPIQETVPTQSGMPIEKFDTYIREYEALYCAQLMAPEVDIISHAELTTLYRNSGDQKYVSLMKQMGMVGEPVICWGPASVEVIDRQGHMIPLASLKDAFFRFMKNFRTRNGIVLHTDAQVAFILPAYIDKSGKKYVSGVNNYGLYILSEIRRDGKISERVRDEVLKGNIRSYSIAGIATDKHQVVSKSGKSFLQIDSLELSEISLVERPANQDANFKLIKESDHLWTDVMKYLPTEQCDLSDGIVYTDENTIWIRTEPGSLMGEYIKSKLLENLPDDLKAQLNIIVTHDFNEIQKSDYRAIYKAALCPMEKRELQQPIDTKVVYPKNIPAGMPTDAQGKTIARVFKDEPEPIQKIIPVLGALAGAAGGGGGAAGVATQAAGAAASAAGGGGDDEEVEKQTQLTPASEGNVASEKDVDTVRPEINSDGTPKGDLDARGIGRTLGQSGLMPEKDEPVPLRDQNELNKAGQPSQQDPWASGSYQVSPVQVNAVKSKGDIDKDIAEEEKRKLEEQNTSHFEGETREKTIIRPDSGMPYVDEKSPERPKDGAAIMPATPQTGYTGSTST